MIFPSKRDWWLVLLLLGAMAVQIVCGGMLFFDPAAPKWVGIVLLLAAGFIGWLMAATYYLVGEHDLVVHCGPFYWTVPLAAIESITPTWNPLSSPALSLDRLWISYHWGRLQCAIMISPLDKPGFLQLVATKVPGLEVFGDRTRKTPADSA